MNTKLLRYKAWLSVLRDVSKEYHGRNIDNKTVDEFKAESGLYAIGKITDADIARAVEIAQEEEDSDEDY